MLEREEYVLKRRKKKIRLSQIAASLKCSQSLLSQWETGGCGMSKSNQRRYKEFIDSYPMEGK